MDTPHVDERPRRGLGTWGDMVRSMGLILVVVGAMLVIAWQPAPTEEIRVVDAAAVAQGAAKTADFTPLLPKLPADWRATSARLEPAVDDASHYAWHIGFVSPAGDYFALEQSSTVLVEKFIAQWTQGLAKSQSALNRGGWSYYVDEAGNSTYILPAAGTTIALVGKQTPEAATFQRAAERALGY